MTYEYIRLQFDIGDLERMNRLGSAGWRVISVQPTDNNRYEFYALMERATERT